MAENKVFTFRLCSKRANVDFGHNKLTKASCSLSRKKGCQIDWLIQMRSNTLFVCEVKMRRREVGVEVIDSMKTKKASLSLPKGVGVSPVLLHLGPVSDALLSSRYFYRIIDIADL